MSRNDIKKKLRERIIELRQLAAMWNGRPDKRAFMREIHGFKERALECERCLNLSTDEGRE